MTPFNYIGKRFLIQALESSDAESLSYLMQTNQDRFEPFLPVTLQQNLLVKDARHYIQKKESERLNSRNFTYAIKEPVLKKVAGLIILKNIDWVNGQGEFAYGLGHAYVGSGWVSEAIGQFRDYAIQHMDLKTFQIIVHAANVPSVQVAKNCGFQWSKTIIDGYESVAGDWIDMECYEYRD